MVWSSPKGQGSSGAPPPVTAASPGTAGEAVSATGQPSVCWYGGAKPQPAGRQAQSQSFSLCPAWADRPACWLWHAELREGGGCRALTKADNCRVRNREQKRHKGTPEVSSAGWERLLAAGWLQSRRPAAQQHHTEPCGHPLLSGSLPKGWVVGPEQLWGKEQLWPGRDVLLP